MMSSSQVEALQCPFATVTQVVVKQRQQSTAKQRFADEKVSRFSYEAYSHNNSTKPSILLTQPTQAFNFQMNANVSRTELFTTTKISVKLYMVSSRLSR